MIYCFQRALSVSQRLPLPVLLLLGFLQRSPVWQVAAEAGPRLAGPVAAVVRSVFTLAAMGTYQALAGATQLAGSPPSPASAKVGVAFAAGFAVTGTPSQPQSYEIRGQVPPGLSIAGISGDLVNAGSVAISGTPTTAGTYGLTIRAWNAPNKTGLTGTSFSYTIVVAPADVTPPTISSQPAGATVAAGGSITLSVVASGTGTLSYQWRKDGTAISGATSSSLTLSGVSATAAGSYTVAVTNSGGTTVSSAATLQVTASAPVIATPPASATVAPGGSVTFMVTATGSGPLTYQWRKDGTAVLGATASSLNLSGLTTAANGDYTVAVTDANGTTVSAPATLLVATPEPGRLINLSVRSRAGVGGAPLIVGFVVGGGGSKSFLMRVVGPTLSGFGVSGALSDPRMELHATVGEADTVQASNDNWGGATALSDAFAAAGAFSLANATSLDAALIAEVDGARTVHALATTGASGEVVVELYDRGSGNTIRLKNVSARNRVTTSDLLTAGFVISGNVPKRLLIRGVGPRLGDFGVSGALSDPVLKIYTGETLVAENDNWGGEATLKAAFTEAGAFEIENVQSRDSAVIVVLPPKAAGYTAQVSSKDGSSGEALVEVYELP